MPSPTTPGRYGSPFDAFGLGVQRRRAGGGRRGPPRRRQRGCPGGLASGGLARIAGQEVNTYALESLKGDMALTLLDGTRAER